MRRVLFLIDRIEGGGAERQMLQVVELARQRYDVSVFCLHKPEPTLLDAFTKAGGNVVRCKPAPNTSARLFYYIYFVFFLFFYKRKNNIHKSISFLEVSNFINILSGRANNGEILVNVRNFLSHQYSSSRIKFRIAKQVLRWAYNKASKVLCNSAAIKEDLVSTFKVKSALVEVVYNLYDFEGLDFKSMAPLDIKVLPTEGKTFLFCGRLAPQKGVITLISTFIEHLERGNGTEKDRLLILGAGNLEAELKSLSAGRSNICFLGHTHNPYPYFRIADVFILNSDFEGFPNALAEAVLLGCYPLSSDCKSGPREILSNFKITNYEKKLPSVMSLELGSLFKLEESNGGINTNLLRLMTTNNKLDAKSISTFKFNLKRLGEERWKTVL